MSTVFLPHRLEVEPFAEAGAELSGQTPLAAFQRLVPDLYQPDAAARASWVVRGLLRPAPDMRMCPALRLQLTAGLPLQCQRCLGQVLVPARIDRHFIFAPDESSAARLDADCGDDVLVLQPEFDLRVLMEDELILALPLVPRHQRCAVPPGTTAKATDDDAAGGSTAHPFEILRGWTAGRHD